MVRMNPCLPVREWWCCHCQSPVEVVFRQTRPGAETDLDRALVFVVLTVLPRGWWGGVAAVIGLLVWATVAFSPASCWQDVCWAASWVTLVVVIRLPTDLEMVVAVVSLVWVAVTQAVHVPCFAIG